MSKIQFISHHVFPDDEYTRELVYLCLEDKYRVAYVRKQAKNGGMYWGVVSVGVASKGQKEFFPAFLQDSNFLERDIKEFLDKRKWESALPSVFTPEKKQTLSVASTEIEDLQEKLPF